MIALGLMTAQATLAAKELFAAQWESTGDTIIKKLNSVARQYPWQDICDASTAIDTYYVTKRETPYFTHVQANTNSAPDGLVAAESCYLTNVGLGWAGICQGFSDGKVYLGSDNGYFLTETRLRFFRGDSAMSFARCISVRSQTAGVASHFLPDMNDNDLPY